VRHVIGDTGTKDPDPEEVVDVVADCDKKASTKNIMLVAMKSYFKQIGKPGKGERTHELAQSQNIAEIDFNREMEVDEWITKDEFERVVDHILPDKGERFNELSAPGESHMITLEHKALVVALFYTGCRVGEICKRDSDDFALEVDDIYWDEQQIKMYRLKKEGSGVKRDMKVVPDELLSVLEEYLEAYGMESGPIFDFTTRTAQNRITDIHEAYTFAFGDFKHTDKLTPHKFRHGRISDIANHSDLDSAGEYVEHSSTEITKAYRHLASEQQREILPETGGEGEESDEMSVDDLVEQTDGVSTKEELLDKISD
jgi:integrase